MQFVKRFFVMGAVPIHIFILHYKTAKVNMQKGKLNGLLQKIKRPGKNKSTSRNGRFLMQPGLCTRSAAAEVRSASGERKSRRAQHGEYAASIQQSCNNHIVNMPCF